MCDSELGPWLQSQFTIHHHDDLIVWLACLWDHKDKLMPQSAVHPYQQNRVWLFSVWHKSPISGKIPPLNTALHILETTY